MVTRCHPKLTLHARCDRVTPTTSSVETTFDFLNTLDHDDGFPREHLPTLDDALDAGSPIAA